MRAWVIIGWVLLLPGLLRASPVPPPPDDFSGAQYIDGAGCVHLRSGAGWQQRLDSDGAAVCGFPPSLPAVDQNAGAAPSTQERLADMVASDLRPGEWVGDQSPVMERREPAPAANADKLTRDVAQSLQVSGNIRAGAAPVIGGDRICGLLGYARDDAGRQTVGQDVTLGMCPGMRAGVPAPQIVVASNAPAISLDADAAAGIRVASPERPEKRATKPRQDAYAKRSAPHAPTVVQAERPVDQTEMIPASARFVRVSAFADDANANLLVRKLSAMGYPVGQRYEQRAGQRVRVIMAGPFTDRQSLISALNRIRRSGYPGAGAR